MRLNDLKPAPGSRHRRKVLGRGEGSGHGGKGCTRGFKGQTARSGDKAMRPGFEGGQMPLYRRIPKRGFSNETFRRSFVLVNVGDLGERFEKNAEVTVESLTAKRLVRQKGPVKVLGNGELSKPLKIKVHAFSKSAEAKVKKAGGSIELIEKAAQPAAPAAKSTEKAEK